MHEYVGGCRCRTITASSDVLAGSRPVSTSAEKTWWRDTWRSCRRRSWRDAVCPSRRPCHSNDSSPAHTPYHTSLQCCYWWVFQHASDSPCLAFSLRASMTSSTIPDGHNILHCRQRRTDPQSQTTVTTTLFLRYAREQTDTHTPV